MPIYTYETRDGKEPVLRFEVKQTFNQRPLLVDPDSGRAVRRVITGGLGVIVSGSYIGPSVGSCGSGAEN